MKHYKLGQYFYISQSLFHINVYDYHKKTMVLADNPLLVHIVKVLKNKKMYYYKVEFIKGERYQQVKNILHIEVFNLTTALKTGYLKHSIISKYLNNGFFIKVDEDIVAQMLLSGNNKFMVN